HPLVDFFLAVFFVSLGAGMDPVAAMGQLGTALLLSAFVLIGKPLIVAVLLGRMGHDRETAFLAGVTLGQISEFAFILTAMAAAGGLIGEQVLSLVGLVGLITIGMSSVLVPMAPRMRAALESRGLLAIVGGHPTPPPRPPAPEGHVVVVGMNTLGRTLVERFAALGERVVAVDTDATKLADLPAETLVGSVDSPALLREADVQRARLVVSALQIEEANSMLTYRCGQLGVPVSIHAFDPTLVPELRELGARHLMVSKHDGIRQMAAAFRRLGVIQ
ncbi:MAG: NAD-binding protein, partial [Gemmatimonadota bacterium]